MNKHPIALCGKFRAGKDEVARYLVENYGYTRYAFADEMKRAYYDLFGGSDVAGKPREGLVWFGQMVRERDPDVWIRKMFDSIDGDFLLDYVPPIPVVSDLRLDNEYERLDREGYVLIEVTAPEHVRMYRALDAGDNVSPRDFESYTETALDGHHFDYTIPNDGTLEELYAKVDAVMAQIGGGVQ